MRPYLKFSSVIAIVLIGLILGLDLLNLPKPGLADPMLTGYPNSIAALGDSITQAADVTGAPPVADHPDYSWSTGTQAQVNSLYSRLLAVNPAIVGRNYNDAVSGAQMSNLAGQASNAVSQNPDYVTILMGGNDICNATNESGITLTSTFQTQFQAAMNVLSGGLPNARIFVASIPDIYNLWSVLHNDSNAQGRWNGFNICPAMLSSSADDAQRGRVRQRIIDFNMALKQTCTLYVHCRFDNNTVFSNPYLAADVSTLDYFHPSISGQAKLAAFTKDASFDFSDTAPPLTTISGAQVANGLGLTLSATDNIGVSGIEYRLSGGNWTKYNTPPTLTSANPFLEYRAVDLNGNIEASRSVYAVTSALDDGTFAPGSLSFALKNITPGPNAILFAPGAGVKKVDISDKLQKVPAGIKLDGGCPNGPGITLNWTGAATPVVDGLVLSGNNTLNGLRIKSFPGKQLYSILPGSSNHFSCFAATK